MYVWTKFNSTGKYLFKEKQTTKNVFKWWDRNLANNRMELHSGLEIQCIKYLVSEQISFVHQPAMLVYLQSSKYTSTKFKT